MSDGTTSATPEPIPQWNPFSRNMIDAPTISVVFAGLLLFCYNEDRYECEVGVHNASDHFLTTKVWENERLIHSKTVHAATVTNEAYSLRGSAETTEVRFYQPTENFDRAMGNHQDFRFIPDLESSEFYGPRFSRRTLTKRPSVVRPRFILDTGLFYALRLSSCEYRRQDRHGTSIVPMGQIATHLGAKISLATGDYADVTLPGDFTNRRFTHDKNYKILFANICAREDCVNPGSTDPEEQNDFHFFHATFSRNANDPLLYIMPDPMKPCIEKEATLAELGLPPDVDSGPFVKLATDRAPCASAGYGSGGGLGGG